MRCSLAVSRTRSMTSSSCCPPSSRWVDWGHTWRVRVCGGGGGAEAEGKGRERQQQVFWVGRWVNERIRVGEDICNASSSCCPPSSKWLWRRKRVLRGSGSGLACSISSGCCGQGADCAGRKGCLAVVAAVHSWGAPGKGKWDGIGAGHGVRVVAYRLTVYQARNVMFKPHRAVCQCVATPSHRGMSHASSSGFDGVWQH